MADDTHLLFIASQRFESGKAIRGAFLLTDGDTKPLEFRCTNPIRPTSLQTVLYGQMLNAHLMVELIGLPLVNSLKQPPTMILVQEPDLLGLRQRVSVPVLQITKESAIAIDGNGDGGRKRNAVLCIRAIRPYCSRCSTRIRQRYFGQYTRFDKGVQPVDLLEPFQRVLTALEQVHQQKIGESK